MDDNLLIKVGDFGLSRDTYLTDYYRMTNLHACPVKWMPPEMLQDGISTEKSDVVSCLHVESINTKIVNPCTLQTALVPYRVDLVHV